MSLQYTIISGINKGCIDYCSLELLSKSEEYYDSEVLPALCHKYTNIDDIARLFSLLNMKFSTYGIDHRPLTYNSPTSVQPVLDVRRQFIEKSCMLEVRKYCTLISSSVIHRLKTGVYEIFPTSETILIDSGKEYFLIGKNNNIVIKELTIKDFDPKNINSGGFCVGEVPKDVDICRIVPLFTKFYIIPDKPLEYLPKYPFPVLKDSEYDVENVEKIQKAFLCEYVCQLIERTLFHSKITISREKMSKFDYSVLETLKYDIIKNNSLGKYYLQSSHLRKKMDEFRKMKEFSSQSIDFSNISISGNDGCCEVSQEIAEVQSV